MNLYQNFSNMCMDSENIWSLVDWKIEKQTFFLSSCAEFHFLPGFRKKEIIFESENFCYFLLFEVCSYLAMERIVKLSPITPSFHGLTDFYILVEACFLLLHQFSFWNFPNMCLIETKYISLFLRIIAKRQTFVWFIVSHTLLRATWDYF